jgi:phosphoenolpyruvate---glycerone phosphotransferase subunit DhaL
MKNQAMTKQVTRREFSGMVAGAAQQIREHHSRLSELDSAAGDGDHGASMLRVAGCLERTFEPDASGDLKSRFHGAGWSVLDTDGGASSSLLGTFFLGMADGVPEGTTGLDCLGLASAFEAGLRAVGRQTKARPGDKTMMDSLLPAVEAFTAAAQAGKDLETAFQDAAIAAQAGAEATRNLTAHYGRARLLGEKTRGFQDPGATSIALIFAGFHQGLKAKGEVGDARR